MGNIIKWWDVNMQAARTIGSEEDGYIGSSNPDGEEVNIDELSNKEKNLALSILDRNSNKHAFDNAKNILETQERDEQYEKERESLEIYERLMREAAEDEAKKQAEIEAAKAQAESQFSE